MCIRLRRTTPTGGATTLKLLLAHPKLECIRSCRPRCFTISMLPRRRFFGEQRFHNTATQAAEAAALRGERRQAIEQQTQLRTQEAIERVGCLTRCRCNFHIPVSHTFSISVFLATDHDT